MNQISDRLRGLVQSDIRRMSRECERVGGINLGQGICDLPTIPELVEGACDAIRSNKATYSKFEGIDLLRERIARKVEHYNGIHGRSGERDRRHGRLERRLRRRGDGDAERRRRSDPLRAVLRLSPEHPQGPRLRAEVRPAAARPTGRSTSTRCAPRSRRRRRRSSSARRRIPRGRCSRARSWSRSARSAANSAPGSSPTRSTSTSSTTAANTCRSPRSRPAATRHHHQRILEDVLDHRLAHRLRRRRRTRRRSDRPDERSLRHLRADAAAVGRRARAGDRRRLLREHGRATTRRNATCSPTRSPRPASSRRCRRARTTCSREIPDEFRDDSEAAQALLETTRVASVPGSAFFVSERGKRMLRFCFAKDFDSLEEACKRSARSNRRRFNLRRSA